MSIRAITAVLELAPTVVTAPERLVLCCLAWHADEHGQNAWPAVGTIARKTSLTRRAIQKILPRLKHKKFVFVQSVAARQSIRYGIDLQVLDCERYSQSPRQHCEPGSQSPHPDCEPGSQSPPAPHPDCEPGSRGGANLVQGGGEPGSPDPSLNRPSEEEKPAAPVELHNGRVEDCPAHVEQVEPEASDSVTSTLSQAEKGNLSPVRVVPFKVWAAIASRAHDLSVRVDRSHDLSNVKEHAKRLAAEQGLPYDGEQIGKAVEAAFAAAERARQDALATLRRVCRPSASGGDSCR